MPPRPAAVDQRGRSLRPLVQTAPIFDPVEEVPGHSIFIEVTCVYNSRSTKMGLFGRGWTCNYGLTLNENAPDQSIAIHWFDGSDRIFRRNLNGSYRSPLGTYSKIVTKPAGTYLLKLKHGTTDVFFPEGRLVERQLSLYKESVGNPNT